MALKLQFLIATKDNDSRLQKCLNSLVENLPILNRTYYFRTLIVRQHLTKQTKKTFFQLINNSKYQALNISYIIMKKQSGYIQNLNEGIKAIFERRVYPDYLIFLHDDIIVNKFWFEKMILSLEENKDISIISSLSNNKLDKKLAKDYYSLFGIQHLQTQREQLFKMALNKANPGILPREQHSSISLYSTVVRFEIFQKYGLFDQYIITPFNFDHEYFKNIDEKIALAPNIVEHQCYTLTNLKNNKINAKAAKFNIDLKNQLSLSNKKNVVYTYLLSTDFDKLKSIFKNYNDENIDLICFSDVNTQIDKWKVIDVSLLNLFNDWTIFKQFLKLHPHYFFKNYQNSVWIDFNEFIMIPHNFDLIFQQMTSNYVFLDDSEKNNNSWKYLYQMKWDEKLSNQDFEKVLSLYQIYHFPVDTSFLNSSFMIRKHNNLTCINTMNKIWKYYNSFINDDKFLFNLFLWVNKQNYDSIDFKKFNETMIHLIEKSF